ncbi:ATP-binding protein [Fulvivirga ulvae]|uniref:sensor histidine kinase n=1 Tax=Fulvivirga ulvae TaxID=2904245 RepID=UPI001F45796A|nr:sensor histidine kinase [Fulvivirga ulvae]UII31806.1 ATP-binding protein [Fulvivirga ulvae]
MNIKSKLTYRLLMMVSSIWLVASISIYLSSAGYRQEEFYRRLESRATTAARLLIEFEEVDAELLRKIESANPIKLPSERISIYDYNNNEIFSTDEDNLVIITPETLDKIRLEGQVQWRQEEVEILGMLYSDKFERFVVIAAAHDIFGKSKLENLRNILIIVFFLSIIAVAAVGLIYARIALQPISKVVDEVNTIGAGNLGTRISEGNGRDEVAVLAITFNKMLSRLQDAFKSQKAFISNASHELRTPLTSMLSQIDVTLLKEREQAFYIKTMTSVRDDIQNLAELTNKLLLLARTESFTESFSMVRVDSIMWQLASEINGAHSDYKIKISLSEKIDDEKQLTVKGNEQMLRSVFSNLIDNACKFSPDHEVQVRLSALETGMLEIKFHDTGIGIPQHEIDQIMQPFFRATNAVSIKGHGIGLSLAKRIIDIHEGSLRITSVAGSGTTVAITLPTSIF